MTEETLKPVAWRYRHVPTVGWSYSDSKHPREDLAQDPLISRSEAQTAIAEKDRLIAGLEDGLKALEGESNQLREVAIMQRVRANGAENEAARLRSLLADAMNVLAALVGNGATLSTQQSGEQCIASLRFNNPADMHDFVDARRAARGLAEKIREGQ